jgi:hypothetical protein
VAGARITGAPVADSAVSQRKLVRRTDNVASTMRLPRLTSERLATLLALVCLATIACLSPAHNDTWWHLAYGREMAVSGGFADVDHFSYTGYGRPVLNHQWLAQRLFYGCWLLGGMPLLSAVCGLVITAGWILCWRLTRGPWLDRLLITGGAAAASTLIWSIRPQVFTIALLPLVINLLVGGRFTWVPLVIGAWANLHGGVLLGLAVLTVWTALTAVYAREQLFAMTATLAASIAATLVTPLTLRYWPEVFASLRRSQAHRLQEWQAPGWPPEQPLFWIGAAAVVTMALVRWGRTSSIDDRAITASAVLVLTSAVRSLRNIGPFMMLAAPAVTRLMFPRQTPTNARREVSAFPLIIAVGLAGSVLASAWSRPWTSLGWTPLDTADIEAVRSCAGPIYNTYENGGPLIWHVTNHRVFVDSRQDHFPPGLVAAGIAIESGESPKEIVTRYAIACAAVPPHSPTIAELETRGWRVRHRSSKVVVLTEE